MQLFSYILARASYIQCNYDDVRFAITLKQQSAGRKVIPLKSAEVDAINLKNVFDNISLATNDIRLRNFSINFYTKSCQQTYFFVRIGIKESDQYIATVIMPKSPLRDNATDSILHYIWSCP